MGSSGFEASGLDPSSFGLGGVNAASRVLAKGSTFSTIGGLTASNTALAILGMKSESVKVGGIKSRRLSWGSSWQRGSRLGGSPTVSVAFTSFCSIHEMASPTSVDQAHLVPSWDDEGGLLSLVAVIPRLPSNPSKSPGKKLLSRGLSAAKPTRTSGATSGCLRGPLHSNWHILPRWSVILEESSPIRLFVSCWDCNSPRQNRMNSSLPSRASSNRVRGRTILSWTAAQNCRRAVPTSAFWEGRVVLTWVTASKSLRSLSVAASMSACHIRKVSPKSSPIRTLRQRNSTISDLERA